jgi:3-oxoacyl-[acyl-carrier protein] reductase
MSKMNPLERLGTPEDIAAAVAFFVGPDGSWINGQVLRQRRHGLRPGTQSHI